MKVELNNLKTIKNFALDNNVTPVYIYKLIKENKIKPVEIDGMKFIDTHAFPKLPGK